MTTDLREHLRERADSFGRDAETLRRLGYGDTASTYEVIRDELRKAADQEEAR